MYAPFLYSEEEIIQIAVTILLMVWGISEQWHSAQRPYFTVQGNIFFSWPKQPGTDPYDDSERQCVAYR